MKWGYPVKNSLNVYKYIFKGEAFFLKIKVTDDSCFYFEKKKNKELQSTYFFFQNELALT